MDFKFITQGGTFLQKLFTEIFKSDIPLYPDLSIEYPVSEKARPLWSHLFWSLVQYHRDSWAAIK